MHCWFSKAPERMGKHRASRTRRSAKVQLIFSSGGIEIWAVNETWGTDYYVYGVYASGDPRICPSLDMACEVAVQ